MTDGTIRPATRADVAEILGMIRDLAAYEREPDAVVASEDLLAEALFGGESTPSGKPAAHCLVVDHQVDGHRLGGIALWFLNFSTWRGRHGIYLEDLYVRPECRGFGYGGNLLAHLGRICIERGYERLEWWVLDWNEPAIEFYRSKGAVAMDEWTVFRVTGTALSELADSAARPH